MDCELGANSINDVFEVDLGTFSSIFDLSEEVKGFDGEYRFLPVKRVFTIQKTKASVMLQFLIFSRPVQIKIRNLPGSSVSSSISVSKYFFNSSSSLCS